jgi:hypothetical protein
MAGKGAPPLFDLIRSNDKATPGVRPPHAPARPVPAEEPPPPEARQAPRAAPAPEPKPEPRARQEPRQEPTREPDPLEATAPEPAPATARHEDPSENDEPAASAAESGPRIDFKKKFAIPVSVLYVVVPLLLVGVLIAYSWGFSAGGRDRDNQLKPYLQPEDVVDPLLAGGGASADPAPQSQPVARPASTPTKPPEVSRQVTSPAQRPAGSPVTRDTRQADHNYLLIARMDGERAIKAAMALTRSGVPAIAVETGGGRSNNGWRLYSLLGIPSEKFRQEWQLRADHKARVEAACRGLGADAGGPIDASTAYWEKYAP